MARNDWRTVAVAILMAGCATPPAPEPTSQLIHFRSAGGDTLVVNNTKTVRLSIPGISQSGTFEPIASREIELTASGDVTCRHHGNATIHLRDGAGSREYPLLCRPVRTFYTYGGPIQFVMGPAVPGLSDDTTREILVFARGPDGEPVTRLNGTLVVPNARVARGEGLTVRPHGIGSTLTEVRVGDHGAGQGVYVFERLSTLASLRPGQRSISLPVTLEAGDWKQVKLPPGTWKLIMAPAADSVSGIQLQVGGAACAPLPNIKRSLYCYSGDTIDVRFTRPRRLVSSATLVGELRMQWHNRPAPNSP